FVSGATKSCESCREPVPPGLARLRIVTGTGQPAYLILDATDSFLSLFSPGPPVVTSNLTDNPIVWLLDAHVYRSESVVGSGVPGPSLYAEHEISMGLFGSSAPDQRNVGGKYTLGTVARGVFFVGPHRIRALGPNTPPPPLKLPPPSQHFPVSL